MAQRFDPSRFLTLSGFLASTQTTAGYAWFSRRRPKARQPVARASSSLGETSLKLPNWRAIGPAVALVLLVLVIYSPVIANGFIWDDDVYVENNTALRSAAGLFDIWFNLGTVPQYYPLVHSTFWAEFHLWGLDPRGYHAINLLLHATNAVLFWRLLVRLAVPGAWLAAAVFAVHPVGVESVAWVTERKNVLSCALALGSLLAYLRFSPPEGDPTVPPPGASPFPRWYVLALVLYVAALLSKTVTASVPAVLLIIYWWKRGRVTRRDCMRLAPFFVVGLALAGVTVWMEKTHVGAEGGDWNLSLVERTLVAGRALWFYVDKLVWPHPLMFFYPKWDVDAGLWWQYLFPAAALGVLAALWALRNPIGRAPLAAALIFAGVLVPALGFFNVYPFLFSYVADHFQYHASLALIALATATILIGLERLMPAASFVPPLAVAGLLLPLGILAHQKTYAYRDLVSLYEDTIALNPESWTAEHNLAKYLVSQGQFAAAIEHFRAAAEKGPHPEGSRIGLAGALAALGRLDEATHELNAVLAGRLDDKDKATTYQTLAGVQSEQGRIDAAIESYRTAQSLGSITWDASYNYGKLLARTGDIQGAIQKLREAITLNPNSADAEHELGVMLASAGQTGDAIAPFERAVKFQPANAGFRKDLGVALVLAGDPLSAERQFRQAIAIDPRNAKAHAWLGIVLRDRGDLDAAIAEFQTALQYDPNNSEAQGNMRKALEAAGRASP